MGTAVNGTEGTYGTEGTDPLDAPRVTREQLLAAMPPRVREAFPDPAQFTWTDAALWRLDLPVAEVPLATFAWLLDLPIWRWAGRRFQLSLNDVLRNPERYRAHVEKAERADTAYPIHVTWHNDRWVILDGYHRLLKCRHCQVNREEAETQQNAAQI
jgi:hypothetical protein